MHLFLRNQSDPAERVSFIEGPAADATDAPQPWRHSVQTCDEDDED
jgi:hypothetical protein